MYLAPILGAVDGSITTMITDVSTTWGNAKDFAVGVVAFVVLLSILLLGLRLARKR